MSGVDCVGLDGDPGQAQRLTQSCICKVVMLELAFEEENTEDTHMAFFNL